MSVFLLVVFIKAFPGQQEKGSGEGWEGEEIREEKIGLTQSHTVF